VFAGPFPSNGRVSGSAVSPFRRHVTICRSGYYENKQGGVCLIYVTVSLSRNIRKENTRKNNAFVNSS
jgi:hypothetical protein